LCAAQAAHRLQSRRTADRSHGERRCGQRHEHQWQSRSTCTQPQGLMPMPSLLRYLPLVLGFVATFAAAGGVHQPASSNSLQSLLAPLASLSADFRQVISDGEGYEIQALTGTMDVARPGKVYWKSAPPYEQLVVSDATTLWLYDADLEQVTVRPFDHDIA